MEVLERRGDPLEPSCPDGDPSRSRLDVEAGQAWRGDVALEMWVDVAGDAVVIRLEGILDRATGANLVSVVTECQSDGGLNFGFDTRALHMGHSGWDVVDRVRAAIRSAGGEFHWGTADFPAYCRAVIDKG